MNALTRSMFAMATAALATASHAGPPKEEHFDVWLRNFDTTIGIGAASEDGSQYVAGVRTFGADLGEDPGDPFGADEPGFQALDGEFDPFQEMQLNIVDAVQRWNGGGFSDTIETITMTFGPNSLTSGDGFVSGLPFAMDDEGGFHGHFDIELNGDRGNPANGIYLLALQAELLGTGPSTTPSPTFWFVMNLGMGESEHEAAIDWVNENLVPVPGAALTLLGLGACTGRRRRSTPFWTSLEGGSRLRDAPQQGHAPRPGVRLAKMRGGALRG